MNLGRLLSSAEQIHLCITIGPMGRAGMDQPFGPFKMPRYYSKSSKRLAKKLQIILAAHFIAPELFEMWSHPLGIQQPKRPFPQPGDQRHERDLGCVGLFEKHALSKKCPALRDSVEAALQSVLIPTLKGMRVAKFMKMAIAIDQQIIDPCFRPRGTSFHHFPERRVVPDFKGLSLQAFCKAV